ncbi:DNA cytosine methyltransferase [Bradyrhizobium sp. SZCCHNR1020]|uniref:DNA cytosine methyltransferase n=1 Tax=Bradyrhizobium sp. SZCCHNR1020 TaxID=3057343 RepID=UPI002915FA4F|nr:DNA cytosine methyltransferase [Bradyrhizobium sp. SZCCHNR1020]
MQSIGASGRKFLVADLFCGAGGSSTGAARAFAALGLDMELVCLNHWPVAIDTHTRNHPQARHYCQDIATVRPHLVVPEGYLDLLLASPSCTHHSVARGGRPTSDQQRSDPWHLIPWFTELHVRRALIENVWEYTSWGPVDPATGKPIKDKKGEHFRAWVDTIWKVGATAIEWRKLNAADYGKDATTRQRFIMKVRFDKVQIGWAPKTHAKRDSSEVANGDKLPWKPARDIIDRSIKGRSIFTRKKPLAAKTLLRIHAGIVKFGWPEPFIVVLRNHMAAQGIDAPLPAVTAGGTHLGLAEPVIVNMKGRSTATAAGEPLPTQTAHAAHFYAVEPFVMAPGSRVAPRTANEPLPTITTGGAGSEDPGCARPMLVEPFILNRHGDNGAPRAHDVADPMPTSDCRGAGYLVEPFLLSQASCGAPRSTNEPCPTITTGGAHALISPYYGSGSGETCQSAEAPLPTVTAKARFGVVVPITHSDGANRARDVAIDPLPTITTAHRGELAFIAASFGERPGQAPRVHDIADPAPTICAQGRIDLVEGTPQYDILFRMLEPHELAAAMGFSSDDQAYEFAGTKTDQIKQIGNAVPVGMAEAEIKAFMADEVDADTEFLEAAE